jgi:large subunit ribosomal protein L35Ae
MDGIIINFRRGKKTMTTNQMVVEIDETSKQEEATKLIGKQVTYLTSAGNAIKGKVSGTHGKNGNVRVLFERGMPGQAIGQKVKIEN